ncbi:MAG: hypothetical protein MUP04_07255 [Anaerolineae bacterium]|nr:hypothetical protein [Anaerolineae bacterium]
MEVLLNVLETSGIEPLAALMLVVLLVFLSFLLLAERRVRWGLKPTLRPLPGFALLDGFVGQAVETGRTLHVSMGTKGIGGTSTADTMAGLMALERLAQQAVATGLKLVVTVSDPSLLPIAQDTLRRAYERRGYPQGYDPLQVRYIAPDAIAYAAGVMGVLEREDVAANAMIGGFGDEFLLMGENGARKGVQQIGGASSLEALPFVYISTDAALLGEEIYAGGAYLSSKSSHLGSLLAQDWLRTAIILASILGVLIRSLIL